MDTEHLIKILQASVAPCVLISGAGLLLLSITNRISRPIERIRILSAHLRENPQKNRANIQSQIKILYKRCTILRASITFNVSSIIFISVVILSIFISISSEIPLATLINTCFVSSLVSLIVSLGYFLMDVRLSLNSLRIDIDHAFENN